MSMLDALIVQIQAAPNDDAPRLAWANAVGGERGELVIVQCRLASGAVVSLDSPASTHLRACFGAGSSSRPESFAHTTPGSIKSSRECRWRVR